MSGQMVCVVLGLLSMRLFLSPSPIDWQKGRDLTKKEVERLENGEVVQFIDYHNDASAVRRRHYTAVVWIDASPKSVYDTLSEFERVDEFLPTVEEVRYLHHEGGYSIVYERYKILIRTLHVYQEWWRDPKNLSFRWQLVHPFDGRRLNRDDWGHERKNQSFRFFSGGWWIEPRNGGAQVRMEFASDTKYLPEFIESYFTKKDLPKLLTNLKKRVESGGVWRK